jgi:hypothetical protein
MKRPIDQIVGILANLTASYLPLPVLIQAMLIHQAKPATSVSSEHQTE